MRDDAFITLSKLTKRPMETGLQWNPSVDEETVTVSGTIRSALAGAILATASAGCEQKSPEEIRAKLHLPEPGYVADIDRGRTAFRASCAICHGRSGKGSGSGPPLVHKTYEPSHHPDAAFNLAVKNGVQQHHWNFGNMPPQPGVSPESTADITAYIRYLQQLSGIH